jgi:hypothetical protein
MLTPTAAMLYTAKLKRLGGAGETNVANEFLTIQPDIAATLVAPLHL